MRKYKKITRENIQLSSFEKLFINLGTPYDLIDAFGIRKYLTKKPSGMEAYYAKLNANGPIERLKAIYLGKIEKTKHLIEARINYDTVPERMVRTQQRSICGRLRLSSSYRHVQNN